MLVHPDESLLGMEWNDMEYVNGMMPFGLSSAPTRQYGRCIRMCIHRTGVEFVSLFV